MRVKQSQLLEWSEDKYKDIVDIWSYSVRASASQAHFWVRIS